MSREELARWIEAYERAWRTAGTAALDDLFAAGASYRPGPFDDVLQGREAIASFWEDERDGPHEVFTLSWEPVALEGPVGVVRAEVRYGEPPARVYRDLWVITLDPDSRCTAFEEWPFFPGQPLAATSEPG